MNLQAVSAAPPRPDRYRRIRFLESQCTHWLPWITVESGTVTSHAKFADDRVTAPGVPRAVDVLVIPESTLQISDDKQRVIYRISFDE